MSGMLSLGSSLGGFLSVAANRIADCVLSLVLVLCLQCWYGYGGVEKWCIVSG